MVKFTGPMWWGHAESDADPLESRDRSLWGHLGLVAAVEKAGITPPKPWAALRDRLNDFQQLVTGQTAGARLTATVVDGTPGDAAILLAAASIRPDPAVIEQVQAHVLAALRELYQPHTRRVYAALASRFDAAVGRFVDATRIVDADADPSVIVRADRKNIRSSWQQIPDLAQAIDNALGPLHAAAQLARGDQPCQLGTDPCTLEIPLVVSNIHRLHKRKIWAAWHCETVEPPPNPALTSASIGATGPTQITSRAGRWGLLVSAGATLAANPDPSSIELYGAPGPYRRKEVHRAASGVNIRKPEWVTYDPYDPGGEPQDDPELVATSPHDQEVL